MPQIVLDGKYRLGERLGEGATGVVYRALHLGLKKAFAVKLLKRGSQDPLSLARFRREAEALGQLRHPHVVEVTDFGIDAAAEGIPYLVMELLEGITLADFCREHGPLPLERALPFLEAIAEAVDAAHAQGVLHRDLKPGNILLCPTAKGEPLVKVLDFGLAEILGPRPAAMEGSFTRNEEDLRSGGEAASGDRLTATGALLGTPLYVAPELIRQHAATRASDIYSFGVIAYELLAGHPPFQGSTAKVLAGHLDAEPPAPRPLGAPLPREVWEVLQESLRKDSAMRPTSASDVVRRVRRVAERPASKRWWISGIPRRARLSMGLILIVLLAGLFLPWSVLLWTEQWLQDLVSRSVPARPPDHGSGVTVEKASLAEEAPSLGNHRQAAESGGDVAGEGSRPSPRRAVSDSPADGPGASDLAPQKLVKVGHDQDSGAQANDGSLQADAGPSSAVLGPNDSAPPRNATGGDLAPAPLPVDRVRLVQVADLLGIGRLSSDAAGAWASAKPVALIYGLEGEATLIFPSEERHSLRLFDRLAAKRLVEVGPGSRIALAFADGRRYELGERSRASLGPASLSSHTGPVRPLPAIPPLPCLVPQSNLRFSLGSFREEIRELSPSGRIEGLYPRWGIPTLAGATTLRFEPVEGRGNYRVEVRETEGGVVYAAETTTSAIILPSGILQPGTRYQWTVRTLVGSPAREEADFITVPLQSAEAREALRRAIVTEGGVDSLALLAEVDRCLGLLPEARDELREVVRGSANAAALYHLGTVESDLGDLASAEEHLQRALAIQEAHKPRGLDVANTLHQLGILAWKRGDSLAAEAFERRALDIKEKLAQASLQDLQ